MRAAVQCNLGSGYKTLHLLRRLRPDSESYGSALMKDSQHSTRWSKPTSNCYLQFCAMLLGLPGETFRWAARSMAMEDPVRCLMLRGLLWLLFCGLNWSMFLLETAHELSRLSTEAASAICCQCVILWTQTQRVDDMRRS